MKAKTKLLKAETMSQEKEARKSLDYWTNNPNSYTIKLQEV